MDISDVPLFPELQRTHREDTWWAVGALRVPTVGQLQDPGLEARTGEHAALAYWQFGVKDTWKATSDQAHSYLYTVSSKQEMKMPHGR
jgi:hypothetical protein